MPSFELQLVKCLNEFYDKHAIAAMAYKLPMIRYRTQGFDVYSDSSHYEHYCAFECKSVEAEEEEKLYFSRYFHVSKGVHQLEYEDSIVQRSGRASFLAVELKRRRGVRRAAFLVPWRVVMFHYKRGDVGLEPEEITECPSLEYYKGGYHLEEDMYKQYVKMISGNPKPELPRKTSMQKWKNRNHD
jgi:hypothetical protein